MFCYNRVVRIYKLILPVKGSGCSDFKLFSVDQQDYKARRHYNREQQAMITQDYYVHSEKGLEVVSYEPFIAQLRSGEL